jgi:hypothetical protein
MTTPYQYMMPLGLTKDVLTADGCQDVLTYDGYQCCPPPICHALCCSFVAFFHLLPTGPVWDYWKQVAISYFERNDDPASCPLVEDPKCPSLILHAIYTVLKLRHMVYKALWPAFRESNPNTAITTLDEWLERLHWEDCYLQHCRQVLLGEMTPYEIMGACGPVYCPPDFPEELVCAVKRNIVIALMRANMGIIKNICSINWVIEPLGAQIKAMPPTPVIDPRIVEPCDPNVCSGMQFTVCPTQDWIYGCSGEPCETQKELPKIQAYHDRGCDRPAGLPDRIWPATLAAECIVRSMMPSFCPTNFVPCCDVPAVTP